MPSASTVAMSPGNAYRVPPIVTNVRAERSLAGVPIPSSVIPSVGAAVGRGAHWLAHGLFGGTPAGLQIANEYTLSNKVPQSDVWARTLADMRIHFGDLHPQQHQQIVNVLNGANVDAGRLHSAQLQSILLRAMNPQNVRAY